MAKLDEFYMGISIVNEFCRLNKIKTPHVVTDDKIAGAGYYAFDKPDTIYINLKNCGKTSKYNNPMMIYESTIVGTILHEFGHYLHFSVFPELSKKWKNIKNEPHIHYYQMNIDEDIAECIRLSILNPSHIRKGRPVRYTILKNLLIIDSAIYTPYDIVKSYNKKYEKIDIDKWELFLV